MNLYKLLEKHEGKRNKMYKDSLGIETIGIGHNLRDRPISDASVKQILRDDVNDVIHDVKRAFYWYNSLSDVRQAVVLSMVFNMGLSRFKKFKNTINHIAGGTYSAAAMEMKDSLWARQVGNRADELAEMMRTGKWMEES